MPPSDIILKNAVVITMDNFHPVADLIAVIGDRISAVGDSGDIEPSIGAGTKILDCQGKTLVPGFNDAHLHLFSLVRRMIDIDLTPSAVRSIADIKEAVRREAAVTSPGTWLSGSGYNEFYLDLMVNRTIPKRVDDKLFPFQCLPAKFIQIVS